MSIYGSVLAQKFRCLIFSGIFLLIYVNCRGQDLSDLSHSQPVSLHGNISLQTEFYQANGIPFRRKPFQVTLAGNPILSIYSFQIPFSFIISNITSSFGHPFNQFGISPKYKWIQAYLGYQNIRFSDYTLGGRRIFGAGVDLTPGKWRFGFIYGRFQKAVNPDSAITGVVPGTAIRLTPRFRQIGWGAIAQYGSDQKGHIKLTFFKGRDVASSLPAQTYLTKPKPEANTALSLAFAIPFGKHLLWDNELAVSAFTRDIEAPAYDLGNTGFNWLNPVFTPRVSSQYLTAVHSALRFKMNTVTTSLELERIDPDYRSMGAIYLQNDVQSAALSIQWRSKTGKLSGLVSGGLQENNVGHQLKQTSHRAIGRGMLNWQPTQKFGVSALYSNYGLSRKGNTDSPVDTFGVRQVNSNLSLSPHYMWQGDGHSQVLAATINTQDLTNTQESINLEQHTHSLVASLSHQFSMVKNRWTLGTVIIRSHQTGDLLDVGSLTLSESYSKRMQHKSLQRLGGNLAFALNSFNGESNGYTLKLALTSSLKLKGDIPMEVRAQVMHHQPNSQSSSPASSTYGSYYLNPFTEYRLSLRFSYDLSRITKKRKP